MSGGFPIKCNFCGMNDSVAAIESLLATLVDQYALLVPLAHKQISPSTTSIFCLDLDEDDRVVRSTNVPTGGSAVTPQFLLAQLLAYECVRLEAPIVAHGRMLDSQLTICRRDSQGSISFSIVFPRSEQVLAFMQEEEQAKSVQELFVDMAIATSSQGFVVDYFLPEDPDVEFIDRFAIVEQLLRAASESTRKWRGRSRFGLIVGAREVLVSRDSVRAAWGPSAKIFALKGFVGLNLLP